MNKIVKNRHEQIEDYLKDGRFVTTKELAAIFHTSITTIQRDLIKMEEEGIVERTHGGVMIPKPLSYYPGLNSRSKIEGKAKEKIGKYAANMLNELDNIFIETGSTCQRFYENIRIPKITVFTNSMLIAITDNPCCETYIMEGFSFVDNYAVYGNLVIENMDRINPNKLFFSSVGINEEGKILSFREYDRAIINKIGMMKGQKIMLMDSSKFGASGAFTAMSIDKIDVLITDEGIPENYKKMIIDHNIKLYIV